MKTIKTFLIGALVALIGSSAGAKTDYSKATINLLEGESQTVDTDDLHSKSGSFSWQITQQGNSSIATCTGFKSSGTSHQVLTFTGIAKGTTVWEFKGDSDYWTYTINVESKPTPPVKEVFYEGQRITFANGAYTNWVGSELVVTFKANDRMNLSADLIADLLVVGGGGGGGAGGKSANGTGGNGATVESRTDEPLKAGDWSVTVGAGGSAGSGDAGGNGTKSSFGTIEAAGGSGGVYKGKSAGANGTGSGEYDITGTKTYYGQGGGAGAGSAAGTAGTPNTGMGGQGGAGGKKDGGAGGSGVVIVRFTGVAKVRTPIDVPTAAQNLVYGWTNQVGVAEGEGYVLTGVAATNAVGTFSAFATPDDTHCWTDKSRTTKEITWSIAYRAATVTVIDTNKVSGAAEPIYRTRNENFIAEDPTELVWTAWRTNTSEAVGTYDVVVLGETHQGGYEITYVGGTLEITPEPPPTITIWIEEGEGITDVMDENGESVPDELELPAGTTEVKLELEALGLTVPVFKVVRGNVTNVTDKVATYAIKDGDTLEFLAEEAEEDDPTVTPEQRKQAIIDAIDPPIPGDEEDEKRYTDAKAKVEAVVGENADQVSAKDFAAYITKNPNISSADIAESDYVAASVKLDTDDLINEDTEVEIAELVKAEGDALTFTVDIDSDPVNVEAIKDMVEASSDLAAWAKHRLEIEATFVPGEEGEAGRVTITPKDPTDRAFMKVVIPQDPVK